MLYESLDPMLENGIASICDSDWNAAQDLLSQRLEQSAALGCRRLNLFLLSVVALRVGLEGVATQLTQAARDTPVEMGEPRYFGTSKDPVRQKLEQDWWSFNGWSPESGPSRQEDHLASEELSWASVLDGALEGRAGELERRCSRFLDGDHPQRAILWNLLALGYLESGDLRTYEEMRDQAPVVTTPAEVPEVLVQLLTHAGMNQALADLKNGRWLTSDSLTHVTSNHEGAAGENAASEAWETEMEASFSLLSVGRAVEAARKLGPLSMQGQSSLHRAYALNALGLALFASGEYSGAEEALADSRKEAAKAPQESDPDLAVRFAEWLHSCGAHPTPGSVFCDPFSEVASSAAHPETEGQTSDSFWSGFEQVLEGMGEGDLGSAKRTLRRLASEPGSQEPTQAFLIALLFAGTALLEGDHMETQESIDDASRLLEAGGLDAGALVEAQGRLAAAGAMTLAGKMDLAILPTLDPWRDFPADFPQQSYSGY
jgi:hypothetical protein